MAELNVSTMSESDFVLNDGEVTVLVSSLEARVTTQQRQDKSAPAALVARCDVSRTVLKDAKHDGSAGSDSGVELNGAERSRSPAPIVGVGTPSGPHLDYDGTSEGGSESSSVLSHTPVRKKISSASSSTSSSTPSRQGHPRSRSVVAASPGTPGGSASSAARSRERSTAARGSSCSRGRQSSALEATPTTACRSSSRAQRSVGGNILMTSSMTGSMTLNSSGSHAANNVRGRGTTRAPATARSVPRCSTTAAAGAMNASTDDGRWPSTVQRPTTLSRVRASSVVSDRKNAVHALTSSSSKNSVNSTNSASTPSPTVESKCEKFCTLPRRRRRRSVEGERTASSQSSRKLKVTLYHETAAQTALTVQDLDDLLEGKACLFRPVDAKEHLHQAVQVDLEREEVVAHMLERRLKAVVDMLGFEHSGSPRSTLSGEGISSTVQTPPKEVDHTAWVRTLELLEQRAAAIKKRDLLQRNEIGRLRFEFEQTDRLRKRLQSQQEETEAETMEMQEFLQVEKSMLAESLKEAENEIQAKQRIVINLNEELERQREECQHLVRISEQRRQENLTLQARVTALEQRSKECLLQQGAAVSGAAVALSALNSRLDELAVELEKSSVDKALSTLTLEAKAVTTRTKEACRPLSVYLENNFQTLDNVTEPELEEEGGGQRDSVNTEHGNLSQLVNSESIQNLSAAIFRRLQEEAVSNEINVTDDAPGHLVDQVLEIDSLVTRVLGAVSDAVNSKKLLATNDSNIAANGSTHESMEKVLNQKVEEHVGASKCNNGLLLNGSNEVSCSDSKGTAVTGRLDAALTPEPVIGAA